MCCPWAPRISSMIDLYNMPLIDSLSLSLFPLPYWYVLRQNLQNKLLILISLPQGLPSLLWLSENAPRQIIFPTYCPVTFVHTSGIALITIYCNYFLYVRV